MALYIHVPFCTMMCPFCIFFSVPYSRDRARPYFKALMGELEGVLSRLEGASFREVYVGGGTPTLATEEVCEALDIVRSMGHRFEASVEASPYDIDDHKVSQLVSAGVTRISLGVQSFRPDVLPRIGRPRISEEGLRAAIEACSRVRTVNVDVLLGLPSQGRRDLELELEAFYESKANQLTLYPLMPSIREGATLPPVSERRERELYYFAVDKAKTMGLSQGTVWGFSKGPSGLSDEYIVDFDLFIGVGAGATSHVEGLFYANTFNLRKYEDTAAKGRSPVALARRLSPGEEQRLYALYKLYDLRLPKRDFRRRFGKPVYLAMPREVMAGLALGLLRDRGEELVVTRRGLYAISYLMKAFYIKISQIRAMAIRKGL